MKTIASIGITATCGLLLSGCITHESTVTRDVERVKVEFENDTAARVFYETLSRSPCRNTRSESTSKFEIPVVFEYKRHIVTGPNAAFNQAVEQCDSNKDGKITEAEAKIFAAQKSK